MQELDKACQIQLTDPDEGDERGTTHLFIAVLLNTRSSSAHVITTA